MNETELLDNSLSIMFAGHETTGNSLGWIHGVLALRPELAAQIGREASTVNWNGKAGLDELRSSLAITPSVIEEGLRMYPPVYLLLREATADVEIATDRGIVRFPKGAEVFLDIFGAQRDDKVWGVGRTGYPADEFHHKRWIGERYDLQTFGGGPRSCMGAQSYWTLALSAALKYQQAFQIFPQFDDLDESMTSDFTLQRKGGFPVEVRLRAG